MNQFKIDSVDEFGKLYFPRYIYDLYTNNEIYNKLPERTQQKLDQLLERLNNEIDLLREDVNAEKYENFYDFTDEMFNRFNRQLENWNKNTEEFGRVLE